MVPKLQMACREREPANREKAEGYLLDEFEKSGGVRSTAEGVGNGSDTRVMSSPSGDSSSNAFMLGGYFFCFFRPDESFSWNGCSGIKSLGEHSIAYASRFSWFR